MLQLHVFVLFFLVGQFWPTACGGGPQSGDGGGQVSHVSLSSDSINTTHIYQKSYILVCFQFGELGRFRGHGMERYSSAIQGGGKEEVNSKWRLLFFLAE